MKRILLLLLAGCFLLTLTACTPSESSAETSSQQVVDIPIETTPVTTEPVTEPNVPTVSESETQTPPPAEETTTPTEETEPDNLVKICRADFPVYSGPGYDYFPVGTVEIATVYTMVDEALDEEGNLWGKLKSGAGWVDLTLNEKETIDMPPVTVSRAGQKLLAGGNYHYCSADTSEYAYDIAFSAHDLLRDVSFFTIEMIDEYKRGPELFSLSQWDSEKPFVATVCFPGSASMYGLEFTDSTGVTQVYSVWESGRNGSVEVSPFDFPLAHPDPEPEDSLEPPSIPGSLEMYFSSGAGAWSTNLLLDESGYFSGTYHDSDMGDMGEGYPHGTCYICEFSGTFQITGTGSYTVNLSLNSLDIVDYEAAEWIEDEIRYIASDAYGIAGGSSFLLYMPSTPISELPEDIRNWWYHLPQTGILDCYVLYCPETGLSFIGD